MPVLLLSSLADPAFQEDRLIEPYRGVSDPELLSRRGLFVAEGREVVRRLLENPRYEVQSVLVNPAAFAALQSRLPGFPPDRLPTYVAPTEVLAAMTGVHIHRGCLAVGVRPPLPKAADLLRQSDLVVVLEGVGNADNVGGVFRNAAAFGASAVLLDGVSCDPFYRKAIRTSAAASLAVPHTRLTDWPASLDQLRAEGFFVAALTPRADATPLDRFAAEARPPRLALLLGSEGAGLSAAALARADRCIRIPIEPGVDSLNLAVAAGIALARLSRTGPSR